MRSAARTSRDVGPHVAYALGDMEADVRLALSRFDSIRRRTEELCRPLIIDDYGIQSMPDVSPPKWHLAHTTWFFEEFVLSTLLPGYRPVHDRFRQLFNSYYEAVGPRVERARRGLLSRPGVDEVYAYRATVEGRLREALEISSPHDQRRALPILILGCHHEQQHQELLLTDIKHILWSNPLRPSYVDAEQASLPSDRGVPEWFEFEGGLRQIGFLAKGSEFAFDNEGPRHQVYLQPFKLRSTLVTCSEYLEFMKAGGYTRPEFWLSDGWAAVQKNGWAAPLYWEQTGSSWWQMTFSGMKPVDEHAPLLHLSYYEADAFARWRGFRLPTEQEWETAATHRQAPSQLSNVAWQWTQSAYQPYPGFRAAHGALGEYNAKFMCNQLVLRGGSQATPPDHVRPTYRNFFQPEVRWQFSGVRLAA